KVTTSETNDIVPILNQFVKDHPDFSLNDQKGVVALTGYNGVLGYRTNELNNKDYLKRKKDAEKVVKAMKRDGWTFASHS
ncbi:polysaccharide deacetylase, partial [Salmonella enterica subsp. enterica serovar Typhimurium]